MLRCDCFVVCWFQDDPDVAAEAKRIEDGGGNDDVVRLEKLRKVGPGTKLLPLESTHWQACKAPIWSDLVGLKLQDFYVRLSSASESIVHI
jgi:hypothetical protein